MMTSTRTVSIFYEAGRKPAGWGKFLFIYPTEIGLSAILAGLLETIAALIHFSVQIPARVCERNPGDLSDQATAGECPSQSW